MALIKPVSSLSIKRAVNLYTIILFLSFGILLYWLATDRYQVFFTSHADAAKNTTRIVAFEINKTLREKQRIVNIFVESHKDLITDLSNDPENETIHQALETRLKKYLPGFFAFNIMTSMGKPIIGDFDRNIDKLCLQDLGLYIESGKQNFRIHLNNNASHYDIISKFSTDRHSQLFFISFKIDELSELLNSIQQEKHNLVLINKEKDNLIEVTALDSRLEINKSIDHKMDGDNKLRTLATTRVKDTSWHVIDMRDSGLFTDYKNRITTEYIIAYYIFAIIVLFMRNILLKQDAKRTMAEEQLKKNHEQIKDLNNQLEILSRTDSLTGLFNRRYFDEIISQEWNRGSRSNQTLSCLILDIDYFKDYNDFYGHQAGDKCLKDVAMVLKDTFRRAGDFVARYGGEEFIIIMSDTNTEEAMTAFALFQKELEKLSTPHKTSATNDYVTVSAGLISLVPSNDESTEDLVRMADCALYVAKDSGRNQCVAFNPLQDT
jgi:diguanylate cyclase (GGDEF)-like protein